jgi:DNA-binding protein H-NS
MELNSLDAKQLKQVISDASSALSRRQKVEKAMVEIQRVSKKYRLSKSELKTVLFSIQSSKVTVASKPRSVRTKVLPKYQSQDGSKTWTGRGRTPSWVVDICRSEDLTVKGFKSDARFLIKNSMPNSTPGGQA